MMKLRILLASSTALVLLAASLAYGQTFRGGISGSVADASGAAVPGASVKIVSKGTGLTREQETTTSGDFTFPDLPTGLYTVTVTKQGFQTQSLDNVEVAVGKIANLPVTLGVAQQVQTDEMQSAAMTVEANSSSLNTVVNNRAVQEIPLNGRDFRQLLYLTPGFNQSGSMNGNRSNQNNWQIDGTDNNDFWHNSEAVNQGSISGIAGVLLPIEAIDQFNQQSSAGSDFGRNPGSMVNLVIKSGTNSLHGSAYYFNRNEYFASPSPFSPEGSTGKLRNENYGFSLGGPIVRNKTFFFITYEKQKYVIGNPLQATIISDAWIASAKLVLDKYGVPVNPVMIATYQNLWPSRVRSAPATQPNFFSSDDNSGKSHNGIFKLDQNFGTKHTLSVRAFLGTGEALQYAGSVLKEYFQAVPSRQHNFDAIWNAVWTPRLFNQMLVGVNYFEQTFDDLSHGANPPSWGLNTGVTNSSNFGAPNIEIDGFNSGGVGETPRLGRIDTTGHLTDNLSYSFGAHALKFGGEVRRARLDVFYYREQRGAFNAFDGTAGPWAGDKNFSPLQLSLADFVGGYLKTAAFTTATGDPQRDYYENSFEWWAQDNWQATPRLNINYGLRWTYNGRLHDPKNSISTFLPTVPGGIAVAGKDIDALYPGDWNNYAPRVGFAFTPKRGGRLVIRGAYGLFYDIVNGNLFIDNRAGSDAGRGVNRNPGGPNPVFSLSNPGPEVVANGVPVVGSATPTPPFKAFAVDQGLRSPYVQNFNINVQYQLSRYALVQVGYVGNQARKLVYTHNINQVLPDPSGKPSNTRRPFFSTFPQFTGITEISTGANSQYNAFQTSLRTTSWHGISSQFGYTLGHARDEMSNVRNNRPTDNYNLRGDYGNADFDVRNNFSGYIIYDVPQLAHSLPRLTKGWQFNTLITFDSGFPFTVYAGKEISGTNNGADRVNQTGDPFSGLVQPPKVNGRLVNGVVWFNPAAFVAPPLGTYGTEPRNNFYGPDFKSTDFSIFKNTPINERISTQFRVEIFNLFNVTNLGGPANTLAGGGLITGTRHGGDAPGIGFGEPRNVQFALKIIF